MAATAAVAPSADPPVAEAAPRRGPLAPDEAQSTFALPDDLRIELAAAEPQVADPVAMAFDAHGALWVVEMGDYPNGPPTGQPPLGRIKRLEDRDGDGYFEHAAVFAEELLFANGLLPWRDGLVVTAAPHVLLLRDTDGDGRADVRHVLYEGFAALNPQLRVSHPQLGLDGWVYVANGLRGGQVIRAGAAEAPPIALSGMDFRFNLRTDQAEAISGMGQFGNTFDDWGNRFVCDNRHHLRHVVLENRYLQRNAALAVSAVLHDTSVLPEGQAGSGAPVFPLSRNWTTSNLHAGRFTAACGVFIYRETLLPPRYRGAAFTCDPTGNLVHAETLTPEGGTFTSRPLFEGREFLATPDDWFRPVSLAAGPDGGLYVADMCRAVIEHPDFMPPELKNRPDLTLGRTHGRIWRIVPKDHRTAASRPNLADAPVERLVEHLANPAGWWRSTAHRLLLQGADQQAIEPLRRLVRGSQPLPALHAAWLLNALGALSADDVLPLLHSPEPRLRRQAVLLAEALVAQDARLAQRLLDLAGDPDAAVRFQTALSLGQLESPRIVSALARIAAADADDPWTRVAIASSLPAHSGALVGKLLGTDAFFGEVTPGRLALLKELSEVVGGRRDPAEVAATCRALVLADHPHTPRWQAAVLD